MKCKWCNEFFDEKMLCNCDKAQYQDKALILLLKETIRKRNLLVKQLRAEIALQKHYDEVKENSI